MTGANPFKKFVESSLTLEA